MSLLVISGAVIRMGGRTLLNGADLTIDPGRRIGLVGRNGAGKSTLLRAIAGEIALDGGDIRLSSRARMATVRQEAPEGPMSTASPDTWADVLGVATHRPASACEPYFEIASWRSRAWYAGDRQPLSTTNRTPSAAASVAALRRAPRTGTPSRTRAS